MSDQREHRRGGGRLGWAWRRSGSPASRWIGVVGGPLFVFSALTLYALFPDPDLWTRLVVLLFLPGVMFGMLIFEDTGATMRRDSTGRPRRSRR